MNATVSAMAEGTSWLTVLHCGETGVERGAYVAALAEGLPTAGVMRSDRRDELGPLDEHVSRTLVVSSDRGPRAAALATLAMANALLLVVPDAGEDVPSHLLWLLTAARARHVRWMVADPRTNADVISGWLAKLRERVGTVHLYVTGPRATRWAAAKSAARKLLGGVISSTG